MRSCSTVPGFNDSVISALTPDHEVLASFPRYGLRFRLLRAHPHPTGTSDRSVIVANPEASACPGLDLEHPIFRSIRMLPGPNMQSWISTKQATQSDCAVLDSSWPRCWLGPDRPACPPSTGGPLSGNYSTRALFILFDGSCRPPCLPKPFAAAAVPGQATAPTRIRKVNNSEDCCKSQTGAVLNVVSMYLEAKL